MTSPKKGDAPCGRRVSVREHYYHVEMAKPAMEVTNRVRLIAGNANPALAKHVARALNLELTECDVKQFSNGEINIKIKENVRGDDCYILQPTTGNENIDVNTALMELLLLVHTLRLSSVRRITAVIPYFAYSRQDRKTQSRVPISASAVAQLIQSMGVDRVLTVDLHCGQIQGFFRNMPLDNLLMYPEFARYIEQQGWFVAKNTVVVSPDAGGVERANVLADRVGASHIVTILKRRVEAGKVESMQTVGNVEGFTCIIVDDMVDTGGTLCKAVNLLRDMGATKVVACATHGIMTGPACMRVMECDALAELVVSDSIPQDRHTAQCSKLTVLSIAPLVAQAVSRLHNDESLSALFPVANANK
jgi:ribose-phosphate pyrophosphokinase